MQYIFVYVTFPCFDIGSTWLGGSSGLNVKSNLSFLYQTVLSFTNDEFNLVLVHFNNSRALIAGLKGFALFWQQKVFIKFTCLFAFCQSVELSFDSPRSRNWCCGIVREVRFEKAVRFIYQYSWNHNSKILSFFTEVMQASWIRNHGWNRHMISVSEMRSVNF